MRPTFDRPEIFFLPLAVPDSDGFGSLDADVVARRLPDFLHQILNGGMPGPIGMLEVQSPPDEGPVRWQSLADVPEPEDAFGLVPDDESVRAVVYGRVRASGELLRLEIHVAQIEDLTTGMTTRIQVPVRREDPVPDLLRLMRRLARVLDLAPPQVPVGLLTRSGAAFFKFLEALDAAALLSGDLAIEAGRDRERLMRPFYEALALDPEFGLALRMAHTTLSHALDDARLGPAACMRFFDDCFAVLPRDGDACVAVGDHLQALGEDGRAQAWYEHATHLDPPPPRGLENLGILFANRGETVAARDLWQQGLEIDGHPDFFAHLARLAFTEGREQEGWERILRGLRRVHERAARRGEWEDDGRGSGILLRYTVEHLGDSRAPDEVVEALMSLSGLMTDGEDRVELGLCLLAVGARMEAREEFEEALEGPLDVDLRDQAVRALLQLDVDGFERRFAKAVDTATHGRQPRAALAELQTFTDRQPGFWPAVFFRAVVQRRSGSKEAALDLLAEVLRLRPGQPDALAQMGLMFQERGNPKRALECVDEALLERRGDVDLLCQRARHLLALDRWVEARRSWSLAAESTTEHHPAVEALRERFEPVDQG